MNKPLRISGAEQLAKSIAQAESRGASYYKPGKVVNRPGKMLWKVELKNIIEENKHKHSVRDKVVGTGTKDYRTQTLYQCFTELREMGYMLDNPRNLREKHFKSLLAKWMEDGKTVSTIQNRTSVLRTFAEWIGRKGLIKPLESYVDNKELVTRHQATEVDKSWEGNGVDFNAIVKEIHKYDPRAAMMLVAMKAFGLRREEAVCFQPIRAMKLGEDKGAVFVEKGTKNGLKRYVPIETEYQRNVLSRLCANMKSTNEYLGWPDRTLKQSLDRLKNIMTKFGVTKKDMGVTMHGLRHEFNHDIYERETGEKVPVRGGDSTKVDPELDLKARHKMTMASGHARLAITTAYSGAFPKQQTTRS